MLAEPRIAYFSMEIALDPAMPTYSGGLGILAGDTLRSAADLKVPMCAVSLVHRRGYLRQRLDANGYQRDEPAAWRPEDLLEELPARTSVGIEGRRVVLRAWRYEVEGIGGFRIPVLLLDADLPENADVDRELTHYLYGGDSRYRLCQELILGVGGVRILRGAGFDKIEIFHMNEGHASLLGLELLEERAKAMARDRIIREDVEAVRKKCVFTTHTPVPAGHDRFPMKLVNQLIGHRQNFLELEELMCPVFQGQAFDEKSCPAPWDADALGERHLNLTFLALNLSHYVNGVANKHAEISQLMFAEYRIDAITNGVHAATWISEPFAKLFDRYIPGWKGDSFSLRYALKVPREEVWEAHRAAKHLLVSRVNAESDAGFEEEAFTIGFARRTTEYKRPGLIVSDSARLKMLAKKGGPLQIVFAGKAHPADERGKEIIREVVAARAALAPEVRLVYLENYEMGLAKLVTAGSDLWLNTPLPPLEASGTSGMKAAMNGVPSLSVLDGWWIEGCIEGVTGWAFGAAAPGGGGGAPEGDGLKLYEKLEQVISLFYNRRDDFIDIMRHCIALNGSFFNTQRMMQQYVLKAYFE